MILRISIQKGYQPMNIFFIIFNLIPSMPFQDVNLKTYNCFPQKPDPSREAFSGDFYSILHIYPINNLPSSTWVNPSFQHKYIPIIFNNQMLYLAIKAFPTSPLMFQLIIFIISVLKVYFSVQYFDTIIFTIRCFHIKCFQPLLEGGEYSPLLWTNFIPYTIFIPSDTSI